MKRFSAIGHLSKISPIYADDIALMISGETFGPIEQSLSEDLDNMSLCFTNWRLKINTGKTVCTNFHLAHRLAKYQLQITCEGQNIPHEHRRTGRGVRGQLPPPNSGSLSTSIRAESRHYSGKHNTCLINAS